MRRCRNCGTEFMPEQPNRWDCSWECYSARKGTAYNSSAGAVSEMQRQANAEAEARHLRHKLREIHAELGKLLNI